MSKKKTLYTLPIPEGLVSLGLPRTYEGRNSIKTTIRNFISDNLEELIEYYRPADVWIENGLEYERITFREKCEKEALGYIYTFKDAEDMLGEFEKCDYMLYPYKSVLSLVDSVREGTLNHWDFKGYVPSYNRFKYGIVGTAIIRKEMRNAILGGYYFKALDHFIGTYSEDYKEMFELGIVLTIQHEVLDDIIRLLPKEDIELDNPWISFRTELDILTKKAEAGLIDVKTYKKEKRLLEVEYWDIVFGRRRTQETIAALVDVRTVDLGIKAPIRDKAQKILFNAVSIGYVKTEREKKADRIINFIKKNPDTSIRKSSKVLGISTATYRKYKSKV